MDSLNALLAAHPWAIPLVALFIVSLPHALGLIVLVCIEHWGGPRA